MNRGRDWVKNGDGWRVLATHDDGALTVEHRRHHGRVTLPADYVNAHVELDYARTIRRAQGMTVDHAHLIVDPQLNREDLYVGLSRARLGTRLYVATMTDPGPDHHPDSAGATRDVLTGIITRSAAEPSASEAIRDAAASLGDLRRMAVEYEHALGVHVGDRYRQSAEDIHPGITADPAWPNVAHRLHLAEGVGWSVKDVLVRAEGLRSYADARSDAQVLVFRLDRILAPTSATAGCARQAVPPWLGAAPPTALERPWDTYLPGRYGEMADGSPPWPPMLRLADQPGSTRWVYQVLGTRQFDRWSRTAPYTRSLATTHSAQNPPDTAVNMMPGQPTIQALKASHAPPPAGSSGATMLLDVLNHDRPTASDDLPPTTRSGPARHV